MYTKMHSGGLELAKLTYTRVEDNLIRHGGDRVYRSPRHSSSLIREKVVESGSQG